MKVYNKKGLLWGLFWTALGLFSLYRAFVAPDSFWLQQVKSVVIAAVVQSGKDEAVAAVIAAVVLLMGATGFVRAFSKTATREDRIAELDERNRLVKLKYKARTFDIMFWITMAVMLLSLLAYLLTENLGWGFLFVTSGVLAGISILVELIAFIYYERRE